MSGLPNPQPTEQSVGKRRRLSPQTTQPLGPLFSIQNIPSKGKGLVAQRNIKAHSTVILSETPILSIPSNIDENDGEALESILTAQLSIFTPTIQAEKTAELFDLHNAHPDVGELTGILLTNGFSLETSSSQTTSETTRGLFLEISRINHSCRPNCMQIWSWRRRVMELVPVRDIEVGEEITITYMPDGENRGVKETRKLLKDNFGFFCECKVCVAEGGEGSEIDVAKMARDGFAAREGASGQ
jgi:hypothetical protein